ncbi:MAG: HD domain-containing protein [Candidatus Pacebacteria bacterium]|nr:HD domain-containing protein [Candidatus Paceibacterota bacterium]MDD5356555.1 HD domain-containing protein [Candidatus Paceibacterota bacterium]
MEISTIYKKYKIVSFLEMHMYRVAGVALYICQNAKEKVLTDNIVSACLLHDMGNILKFDFTIFPEVFEPEGIPYWQKVRVEFAEKYGEDEHNATLAIAKEIGVSEKTYEYILSIGFSKIAETFASADLGKYISTYADMRVSPYGVVSMEERLAEGHKRYENSKRIFVNKEFFKENKACLCEMEKSIFSKTSLTPESITSEVIHPLLDDLKKFKIV